MISSRYEYNPDHYRFARHHSGAAPERSEPLSSWGAPFLWLCGVGLCCAFLWFLAWAFV